MIPRGRWTGRLGGRCGRRADGGLGSVCTSSHWPLIHLALPLAPSRLPSCLPPLHPLVCPLSLCFAPSPSTRPAAASIVCRRARHGVHTASTRRSHQKSRCDRSRPRRPVGVRQELGLRAVRQAGPNQHSGEPLLRPRLRPRLRLRLRLLLLLPRLRLWLLLLLLLLLLLPAPAAAAAAAAAVSLRVISRFSRACLAPPDRLPDRAPVRSLPPRCYVVLRVEQWQGLAVARPCSSCVAN